MKPQSPVVQAVPAPAPVVAEAAPEAVAPAPARSERVRAERPVQRDVAPVVEQTAAPAETVAPVAVPVTPVEPAPAATSGDTVSPAVPASDTASVNPADNSAVEWGLIGGGIVLLGGAGLLAMTRRRRLREENDVVLHAALRRESPVEPVVTPEPIAERVPARTVITPAPAAPAYAMARSSAGTGHGDLDAMVAAPPSAENPFRTRKNRLRRAHFLLRQGNPVVSQSQHAAVADAQPQVAKRPAPVFDFGGNMGQRRSWRPATT